MRRIFHGKVHKNPMFFSQNNKFMNKINNGRNTSDNSKKNVNNNTTNNQFNGCNHVQLGGMAHYDERRYFMFAPDDPVPNVVQRRRMCGVAQQMTDGTFDFVPKPHVKAQSKLIKKLAHGRISLTKDKAIQLTLKVMANENINIAEAIAAEAAEGANALIDYQLRR